MICDVSGRKMKASQAMRRWDNAMVHPDHWEPRHPQDYVKGVRDEQSVPVARPAPNVSISVQGSVLTFPGAGVPAAPTELVATSTITGQVDLTWVDNSTTETSFVIERKFTNSPEDPQQNGHLAILTSVGAGVTTFSDTGLAPSQSFDYQVSARNLSGLSSPSNRETIVVT